MEAKPNQKLYINKCEPILTFNIQANSEIGLELDSDFKIITIF